MMVGEGPMFTGQIFYAYNEYNSFQRLSGGTQILGVDLYIWFRHFWGYAELDWIQTVRQTHGGKTSVINDPFPIDDPPGQFSFFYHTNADIANPSYIKEKQGFSTYFYDGPGRSMKAH